MDFIDNNLDKVNVSLQKYVFNKKNKEEKNKYPKNTIIEHADNAVAAPSDSSDSGGMGTGSMISSCCCTCISCILQILGILYIVNMMSKKDHKGGFLILNEFDKLFLIIFAISFFHSI